MKLPFIDLKAQFKSLEADIRRRMDAVLAHGQYIMGPEVFELERALADYTGAAHVVGCASGTDALLWPLMHWGVGPGDAVFVPPFTFVATAEVVSLLGATPVFVDIDPVTYNMDPAELEKAIRAIEAGDPSIYPLPKGFEGLTAKAVIPVDLFGVPADYTAITEVAGRYGLRVLEDACQAFGARSGDKRACNLAEAAGVSFFPAKPLGAYGDAGAAFTSDEEMRETLVSIRIHGMGKHQYHNVRLGMNGRIDTMQAAVLLSKLTVFDWERGERERVASTYGQKLGANVVAPKVPENMESAWAQYTIRVGNRDEVRSALDAQGIPSGVYYPLSLHRQPVYASLGYAENDFPVSEQATLEVMSLPMHPYLSDETAARIAAVVAAAARPVSG